VANAQGHLHPLWPFGLDYRATFPVDLGLVSQVEKVEHLVTNHSIVSGYYNDHMLSP